MRRWPTAFLSYFQKNGMTPEPCFRLDLTSEGNIGELAAGHGTTLKRLLAGGINFDCKWMPPTRKRVPPFSWVCSSSLPTHSLMTSAFTLKERTGQGCPTTLPGRA